MAWLEQRTRIPFAGIVAMVLIVAVVAVFLRTGLNALLPESSVTVQEAEAEQNVRGSASFVGERDIPLEYTDRLRGLLVRSGETITFSIDVSDRMLLLAEEGRDEEVVLQPAEGGRLHAQFEYDGQPSEIVVTPQDRSLTWRTSGLPITVSLSGTSQYEGYFLYRGEQYLIQFFPGEDRVLITGGGRRASVEVVRDGERYHGLWRDSEGKAHPIEIQAERMLAVVGELW